LKPALIQAALAAIRSKDCPFFAYKNKQISLRRGKKRALIAIARMLIMCVYSMLSRNEVFNADLYAGYYERQSAPIRSRTIKKVVEYLSQDYVVINKTTGEPYFYCQENQTG
jgi:hypothetical protein